MAAVSSSSGLKRKAPPGAEDEVKTNKRLKGGLSKYFLPINRGKEKESEIHSSSPERELSSAPNDTLAAIPLETLLDFDSLVSEDDICARFESIARALFHQYRIRIINPESENTTHHLEILEIEFYLIKPGHADPYCHASAEQDVAGRWYFHRAPKWGNKNVAQGAVPTPIVGGEYRSGTRKGLDLTMGSYQPASGTRGGILLRSVRVMETQTVVSGPSLLVDSILKYSGAESIEELVSEHWNGDISAFPTSNDQPRLSLIPVPPPDVNGEREVSHIYCSPRIGLDLTNPSAAPSLSNQRVSFVQRRYRYFRLPTLLRTKGQAENFLGVLYHCLKVPRWSITELDRDRATLLKKHSVIANIEKMTGKTNAARWLKAFEAGTQTKLDRFCGAAGKTSKAGAEHTLSMYGAIAGLGWATKDDITTNNNQ